MNRRTTIAVALVERLHRGGHGRRLLVGQQLRRRARRPQAATVATIAAPAGLPEFYAVPDPLPEGRPGDLITSEQVAVDGLDGTLWRVMYLSESMAGEPIAVTGMIAVPDGAAPEGGWPVVTWAHGTTGIADTCAPSLDPAALDPLANKLLAQGYVVTATDYEGMGTPGRHPYIAGESEGRGVLDIVKTAQQMPEVDAAAEYAIWGHSQGGHAALYAGEIAAEWAPDLELVGVVAGAPPSQLLLINAALQQSPFKYYIAMAAAGLNAAYGDTEAPLDAVLTPDGPRPGSTTSTPRAPATCAPSPPASTSPTLQKADPASVPAWKTVLEENDPGTWTTPIPAPLLIIHGGNDEQIPVVVVGRAVHPAVRHRPGRRSAGSTPTSPTPGSSSPRSTTCSPGSTTASRASRRPTPCSRRARRCPPPSPAPLADGLRPRPAGRGPWSRQEASQPGGVDLHPQPSPAGGAEPRRVELAATRPVGVGGQRRAAPDAVGGGLGAGHA